MQQKSYFLLQTSVRNIFPFSLKYSLIMVSKMVLYKHQYFLFITAVHRHGAEYMTVSIQWLFLQRHQWVKGFYLYEHQHLLHTYSNYNYYSIIIRIRIL